MPVVPAVVVVIEPAVVSLVAAVPLVEVPLVAVPVAGPASESIVDVSVEPVAVVLVPVVLVPVVLVPVVPVSVGRSTSGLEMLLPLTVSGGSVRPAAAPADVAPVVAPGPVSVGFTVVVESVAEPVVLVSVVVCGCATVAAPVSSAAMAARGT
jgi:hypothetical protein